MSETPPPPPVATRSLSNQTRWGNALVLMALIAVVGETYFVTVVASRFTNMFEEMLGSKDKLPVVVRGVISMASFQRNNLLPWILLVVAALPLLWTQRQRTSTKVVCGVLVSGLVTFCIVGFVTLQIAAMQLIRSIGEPDPGFGL